MADDPTSPTTTPAPQRVEVVRATLADERHEAGSPDRAVRATVDGTGRLLALAIDRSARHEHRPDRIGTAVVEVVAAARARVTPRAQELLGAALAGRVPAAGPEMRERREVAAEPPVPVRSRPVSDGADDPDPAPATWLVRHRPGREHRR